ncbi:MAG: SAM-dependent methyltransferase [Actinomadura sp.]
MSGPVDPELTSAGMYVYLLGGDACTDKERAAAEGILQIAPELRDGAWANRGFLQRAARWMAGEGIEQFLDLGAGLPTGENTHQVVQQVNPQARVVYVDNDPRVLARSEALLAEQGVTTARSITADLRDPSKVLSHPDVRELIDFSRPVGVLMVAVLHFIADDDEVHRLVNAYTAAAAPGSLFAISHATDEGVPEESMARVLDLYNRMGEVKVRGRAAMEQLFTGAGLDLAPIYEDGERSVTHIGIWGAEDADAAHTLGSAWGYCGVGQKP